MKKIIRQYSKVFILALAFGAVVSCDDYVDVNKDLDNPGVEDLTPDAMLAGAQTTTASTLNGTMNQLGNLFTTNWSGNATDFSSPFRTEFQYDLTSTFYTGIWSNLMVRTHNFSHIEKYNGEGNWDYHKAISKILKSFYFQYLVDLYGDIPYSQNHDRNILFPEYDNAKTEIYPALYDSLDEAIALIQNTDVTTVKSAASADVILNGNMDEWVKVANTLKLRLLIRQSVIAQTDAAIQTYVNDKFTELVNDGAQFVSSDVTVNPGYINSEGKQNPFYEAYGFNALGSDADSSRRLVGPSKYVSDFLRGILPNTTPDERRFRIYQPRSGTEIAGVVQGATTGRPSYLGPGIIKGSDQDLYLMLSAESYFLQAEAVQRGYLPGSAQGLFNQGVEASFITLGLDGATATNYIANSDFLDGLGWTGSTDKIQAIITQKWIALNSINGIEGWIEYTRTGYPANIPLPTITSQTSRPVRLLYPQSEYSGNSNNVPNQTAGDAFTSKVFWYN
ncbi:SusD/RagB family nutrient-binding outer membrane lipoprotein [Flavobacterium sp.]|uniref:SusD/RagB family nutrient-binding outer membrane lipoprotein n=1 Tax=Flavobacterium sp. TaxID=239 RepID=UPI0028BE2372|nr:SusD/RagB family nutrient-binding outer membrane lipoprotein [Flavobacterium sp.]